MADVVATEAARGRELEPELELVMFPWLAFGHMLPYLELSKRLAARGHTVAFVSTPRNLARLPPVPPGLSARLRFVPLPLPAVDGLPEGAECTADVPPGKDGLLKKAMDGLAGPFAEFLAGVRKLDWIVHDFCYHWIAPIADEHKVPCATFRVALASLVTFMGPRWANAAHPRTMPEDFTAVPEWCPFPSTVAYRRHEAGWIAGSFLPNVSGVPDIERSWQAGERCRLAIYRSCHEIEPGMFALLTDIFQKPSIPVGTLLPPCDLADDEGAVVPRDVRLWLDRQPPKSVLYVALGSEAPLTASSLRELALGLELAGVRFIWALRKPAGISDERNVLPNGFERRTQGRGLVRTGWIPQVKVLAHGAVAAFLTHCGWGSTLESFMFGHPLVMLPFVVDQPIVARAMVDKGIGVEVWRDGRDGSFDRDGVAMAVRRVMVGEESKLFMSNAKKLQEVLVDQGRQEQYIDRLIEHLRHTKTEM